MGVTELDRLIVELNSHIVLEGDEEVDFSLIYIRDQPKVKSLSALVCFQPQSELAYTGGVCILAAEADLFSLSIHLHFGSQTVARVSIKGVISSATSAAVPFAGRTVGINVATILA